MNTSSPLIDGPIGRSLLQLAFPILCANILQCLNGTVSALWVGRVLGEAALTAVANAQSMMVLLTGTAAGITMAATILVGRCMGVDDVTGAKRVISTGLVFFAAVAVALTILGLAFAKPLLIAMRTAPEALPLAVPYMRVMLLALPGMYLLGFVMSVLIGIGDSTTPLKFSVVSVMLGTVLTPTLMFGGERMFGAGVIGTALASSSAQLLCLFLLLRHLHRRHHPLYLTRHDAATFAVDWSIVRELVRKGIPMGAQVLFVSLSSVLMITLVNRFGVDTTAAYGALMQLWTYIMMPALAVAVAVSTMAAQCIGARNWSRVRRTARVGVGYGLLATGAIVLLIYAADSYAYRFFLPAGSAALEIARHVNNIVTWSFAFMSIPLVLFGVMRVSGAVMVPLGVHVFSLLIVRYPLAALLLEEWHTDAIWWSFTISIGIDVVLSIVYYRYGGWHRAQRLQLGDTMRAVPVVTPGDMQIDPRKP